MAKLCNSSDDNTHLRRPDGNTLCGKENLGGEHEGELTCPECAQTALCSMELVTKAEKREWRKL